MELLVLDTNLEAVGILDTFESLIWTERYCENGDFEIYTMASVDLLMLLQQDYYLVLTESDSVMIIEDAEVKFDSENGNYMTITGRSLESILDRRIIWNQTILTGNLQNGIEQLLNENIISPTITDRAIPNFIFEPSTDSNITSLTLDAQFEGENLYEVIKNVCGINNIGFKITLSDDNKFVFKLYSGTDRSYDQILNPYVVFSPEFDNIISSNYKNSRKSMKNLALVIGEGDPSTRKTTVVGSASSISRREIYTNASDISQTVDNVLLPDEDYIAQLSQKGMEDLLSNQPDISFDGQVDTNRMFKYGEDFYMGDIVQLVNEYNIEGQARVTEFIRSQSESGLEIYPTFTMIN